MPGAIFPSFAGQDPAVRKTPNWSTRTAVHTSGRVVRSPIYSSAIWSFALQFNALAVSGTASAVGASTYQAMMGFYCAVQQYADTFLFSDPSDFQSINQALGTGNGSQTTFILSHTFAYFTEAVGQADPGSLLVYSNGSLVSPSAYTFNTPNTITFGTAPAAGVVITATFNFWFVCRFPDDKQDFEQLWPGMWELGKLEFMSVKP